MLRLTAGDGERAVLRLMTKEPWRKHAVELLMREVETQRQLASTALPTPTTLAVDPAGVHAGTPAHLMSWLPGALQLTRDDDDFLLTLSRQLVEIHNFDPSGARPRNYQSWAVPAKRVLPQWTRRPTLWRHAFAVLGQQPPPYPGTFLHRDFHLGNVLWSGATVSGVVDWVETSWGPAGLDVAHCATYIAMLHGPQTAGRFARIYQDLREGAYAGEQQYWDVMDIVGYLPDPTKVVQPWNAVGRKISNELARTRLEERLQSVVDC